MSTLYEELHDELHRAKNDAEYAEDYMNEAQKELETNPYMDSQEHDEDVREFEDAQRNHISAVARVQSIMDEMATNGFALSSCC